MKAYKFRIYPSKSQDAEMRKHLWISKNLWNDMLEHTIGIYDEYGKFPTKRSLRQFTQNTGLYSQVGQELTDRLLDALKTKMRLKKTGEKGGFPRFKSFARMKSLQYPQSGFRLGAKLKVTPFGEIRIKQHREIEGKIKTLTLKRSATGKWFATFCVKQESKPARENAGPQVGIDLGLKELAVISDGTVIHNPRHLKGYESDLATAQRQLSRKKLRSRSRRKAKLRVARLHEKVASTREDFLHKTTTSLVNDYSLIALEELAPKQMAQENYGKQINDAGWGTFANMLGYKAEDAGCQIVFVNPKGTTKTCSCCGQQQDMPLSERIYYCPSCGMIKDRDLNAAINILTRAHAQTTLGHSGSNAYGLATKVA